MYNQNFPIEYYGITPSDYPFSTKIEKIIYVPSNIAIKKINKLQAYINKISTKKHLSLKGLDLDHFDYSNDSILCICNIIFNIEYIDAINDDTISIISDCIYAPLNFSIECNSKLNNLSPKISDMFLKPLNNSSFYLYLSICPW